MGIDNWSLLRKLTRAVKMLQFLLSFNMNRWRLVSSNFGVSDKRKLSFNDRSGLQGCTDDIEPDDHESVSSPVLQRTTSYASDEDIDGRAEQFINNFYRQLQMERQISLKLRYCGGNSLESNRSDSL